MVGIRAGELAMLDSFKLCSILALATFTFLSFATAPTVTVPQGTFVMTVASERMRLGTELQERTSYVNALIANSPLGILVLDQKGAVQLANAAFQKLFLNDPRGGHFDTTFTNEKEASAVSLQVFTGKASRNIAAA
jgi:PAS domain-containing protein